MHSEQEPLPKTKARANCSGFFLIVAIDIPFHDASVDFFFVKVQCEVIVLI